MTSPARLHVVALAHLDTQWRWTVRDTVRDHLPATVAANEPLFERYPGYVLSFEGAHRYRLLEEHHPELFEAVRRRVAEGRWAPAGAAVEAFDTLLPAPESVVRQIVLGRRWFRDRLGVDSRDLFLPDCFGFPATLPTLAAHAGIVGFSTQKLRRGELMRSAFGIPFAYGRWRGPDGSELLAALDPGEYSGRIAGELEHDPAWIERFAELERRGLPLRLLLYVGTGDRGGAAPEATIAALQRALGARGPIEVLHGASASIFAATTDDERRRLPVYEGELLLRLHATGCYSSKAILKRWNRLGERLAFAAEAAAALAPPIAPLIGKRETKRSSDRIESAWWRLLAHQMHDDLTGTSIPAAYRFSLDALGLAANELAEALLDGVSRAAERLDRTGAGSPFVLFSPLAAPRSALVEIALDDDETPAAAVGADGEALPCQVVERAGRRSALVATHFAGVEVQAVRLLAGRGADRTTPSAPPVEVEPERLESGRYRARFDRLGRLASLFDKRLELELLAAPLELELLVDRSRKYPAWEIQWRDLAAPPVERVESLAAREVVERGPLRGALRFEQRAPGCVARSTWSLAADADGEWLALELELDWRRRGRLLELRFPFTAGNASATYDTGLGAIRRPVASAALYEVPAQAWAAIEDERAGFGVAVLTDLPRGWNQPEQATLRTTLLHAPYPGHKFRHQASHDFGRHRWRFALLGFAGDALGSGEIAQAADRFQHPPFAFRVAPGGAPGSPRRTAFVSLAPPLRLLALAPGADGGTIAARLSNPAAEPKRIELALPGGATIARETDALGAPVDSAPVAASDSSRPLASSGLRTLELRLPVRSSVATGGEDHRPVALPWTVRGFGAQGEPAQDGGFDGTGLRLPLELAPSRIDHAPVPFDLSHLGGGRPDTALVAGVDLELGAEWVELWLLCAAIGGDRPLGSAVVPDWRETPLVESRWPGPCGLGGLRRGQFRRRAVVWSAGHLHDRKGNDLPVERASLFAARLDLAAVARLRLPPAPGVRIVAATLARRPARIASEAFAWPAP